MHIPIRAAMAQSRARRRPPPTPAKILHGKLHSFSFRHSKEGSRAPFSSNGEEFRKEKRKEDCQGYHWHVIERTMRVVIGNFACSLIVRLQISFSVGLSGHDRGGKFTWMQHNSDLLCMLLQILLSKAPTNSSPKKSNSHAPKLEMTHRLDCRLLFQK
jgi:hypothetical protein